MKITKKNIKLLKDHAEKFLEFAAKVKPILNQEYIKYIDNLEHDLAPLSKDILVLEEMVKVQKSHHHLRALIRGLEALSEDTKKPLTDLISTVSEVFKKEEDNLAKAFDKKMHGFGKIQEKNNLWSVWSDYYISPSDMKKNFSDKPVLSISYESWGPTQKMKIGKVASWLDMWKAAEQLMKLSGDEHHQFIESFDEDKKKPGNFKLSTGS